MVKSKNLNVLLPWNERLPNRLTLMKIKRMSFHFDAKKSWMVSIINCNLILSEINMLCCLDKVLHAKSRYSFSCFYISNFGWRFFLRFFMFSWRLRHWRPTKASKPTCKQLTLCKHREAYVQYRYRHQYEESITQLEISTFCFYSIIGKSINASRGERTLEKGQ